MWYALLTAENALFTAETHSVHTLFIDTMHTAINRPAAYAPHYTLDHALEMAQKKMAALLPAGGKLLLHTVGWLCFLCLPALASLPVAHGSIMSWCLHCMAAPCGLLNGLLFVAVFYGNCHYAMPKLFFAKKHVRFGLYVLGSFAVCCCISLLAGSTLNVLQSVPYFCYFMMLALVIAFSCILPLLQQLNSVNRAREASELSRLKAQINPHFLFNTLNNLYGLSLSDTEKTPDAILKLSGMMRYTMADSQQETVALDKEVAYLRSFVAMQELRLTEKAAVHFDVTGRMTGKSIAPFLLIPFIENAFKYGIAANGSADIHISLTITDDLLEMNVSNRKAPLGVAHASNGIGIRNTERRLQLLYPGAHAMRVTDDSDHYNVFLAVRL